MNHKTPGIYVEERQDLPPSVIQLETAIPVFIGYTEKADDSAGASLFLQPTRIASMTEYEQFFGMAQAEVNALIVTVTEHPGQPLTLVAQIDPHRRSRYWMYYSLQLYFANGGGPCWIVSAGSYESGAGVVGVAELMVGLVSTEVVDEITLIVFPDAQNLSASADYYSLYGEAMAICQTMKNRFTVMDVWPDPSLPPRDWHFNIDTFRNTITSDRDALKYAAAYFPNVETQFDYWYGHEGEGDGNVLIVHPAGDGSYAGTLAELKGKNYALYIQAKEALRGLPVVLGPAAGIVAIYGNVDKSKGVWKAPVNINMEYVVRPAVKISEREQAGLNVDVTAGKSINVIRLFTGRGSAIVWGSRTLAGNDNEWRYVPVRRFFSMVEASVQKALSPFVFEPNDANTWTFIRSMIEHFLVLQWRAGALMGATPDKAFFVRAGLNETMTELDIQEGRMIVEIGMAALRPAEFIILRIVQNMQEIPPAEG